MKVPDATDNSPESDPMKTARVSLLALLPVIACATHAGATPIDVASLLSWPDVMDVVGPSYDATLVGELDKPTGGMDLPRIAAAARDAAAAVALGYGRLRDPRVPAFTGYAGQTERWLRQIVQAARTGQDGELRALIPLGKTRYCDACHAAAERAGIRD